MPTRCNRWYLLQILLLAQHVSGITMPIISSSRVLMMGIVLPETCWASNKICNKYHLLHLVGILFPHNNDDARSKLLQIARTYLIYASNWYSNTAVLYSITDALLQYVLNTIFSWLGIIAVFMKTTIVCPVPYSFGNVHIWLLSNKSKTIKLMKNMHWT